MEARGDNELDRSTWGPDDTEVHDTDRHDTGRDRSATTEVTPDDAADRHVPVSPNTAAVFGRPAGVEGSFANSATAHPDDRPMPEVAAPDPVLAEAFGRPVGATETLQRDPLASYGEPDAPDDPADPWRDPESMASLTAPALTPPTVAEPTDPGPKLGIQDILFGKRVSWHALATLAVLALVVGLFGGLMGRWTAEVVAPLNSDSVQLSTGDAEDGAPPRSPVAGVARAVEKSVVALDVRTASSVGTGSGFVIDSDGYIVTNNHVIAMAANDRNAKLEAVFFDRTRVPARIVGRDIRTDLAVVKVDNVDNLTVSTIGNSDDLQIGQEVIAFGSPLGLDRTVTSGIVSALNRPVPLRPDAESDTDAVIDAIQTDAAINPGNSGGPLVDDDAEVVGINTAGLVPGGGSIGLGFAIPINQVVPIAQTLIRNGEVRHPQIGVNASSVRNDRVLGAQIRNVVAGGPADRAGVREDDVITSFNGRTIESADELTVAVRTAKIDDEVPFTYWRDGRTFTGTITPASD
ncbi:trypsin-like peptidase domain-containing protein [Gordonia sp. LSe1-13]|uniref:Trypsin-like peptidase domain-containing protein n=1 Tax=Gordonia sesuvii TaxID=3116777 RepID=A0ABU7M7K1_9ACTN|nr:trypsin-like peptidase domain-containing protein [Gordonia sp. LSe1-13]